MMFLKDGEMYILVPKEFISDDFENKELRAGIIMVYCWFNRYGTQDGLYTDSLFRISQKMGYHYDKTKDRHIPKGMQYFKKGIEYLVNKGVLVVQGNINNFEEFLNFELDINFYSKCNYISLNKKYFDYILSFKGRANKQNLLYVLLFVLSCYTKMDNKIYCACSYSLKFLSLKTGISELTLYNYLAYLSSPIENKGNKPLIKSRPFYIKIKDGRIIRFPNIYVENTKIANDVIEHQKIFIMRQFKMQKLGMPNEFYDIPDYDDLY